MKKCLKLAPLRPARRASTQTLASPCRREPSRWKLRPRLRPRRRWIPGSKLIDGKRGQASLKHNCHCSSQLLVRFRFWKVVIPNPNLLNWDQYFQKFPSNGSCSFVVGYSNIFQHWLPMYAQKPGPPCHLSRNRCPRCCQRRCGFGGRFRE